MSSDLRKVIREVLETTSHEWKPASRETLMLDKPGIEDSDKENQEQYLKSLGLMEGVPPGKILIPPPPSDKYRASELSVVKDQYSNRKNPEALQDALDKDFGKLFDMAITSAKTESVSEGKKYEGKVTADKPNDRWAMDLIDYRSTPSFPWVKSRP